VEQEQLALIALYICPFKLTPGTLCLTFCGIHNAIHNATEQDIPSHQAVIVGN